MTQRSPSSGELAHYGVKGMKWGVRRAEVPSSTYGNADRARDASNYGKSGAKRIGRRVQSGKTLSEARKLEDRREAVKLAVAAGASAAAFAVAKYADVKVKNIDRSNKEAADRLADMFGPKGIGSEPAPVNYAKKNRKGVYNITTM